MRKTALLVLIILLTSCEKDKEDSGPTLFTFNGQIGSNDNSTIVTSDDNLVICGNHNNTICLIKMSKEGTLIWRKDIYAGYGSFAKAIIQSNYLDLFICGYTYINRATSESDVLLIKTNSNGDTLWTRTYGGNLGDGGSYIINSSDGNIVICGTSFSYTSEVYCDIYLVKVNTNGDTLWTRTYRDHEQEIPYHTMQTENGEYLITGRNDGEDEVEIGDVYCANPSSLLHLLKVDIDGNKLWHKNIGTHCWNEGYCTLELTNGDLLTCGRETDDFYTQLWLIKTDNLGNVIWERSLGDINNATIGYSMAKNSDNTYTVLGTSNDESNPDDVIILKIDQQGDAIWSKKFGGQKQDCGFNIIKDSNDDNIITGMTYSYGQGASDGNIFMTKVDGFGNYY